MPKEGVVRDGKAEGMLMHEGYEYHLPSFIRAPSPRSLLGRLAPLIEDNTGHLSVSKSLGSGNSPE